jgi:type VI secretion system protein VasD
MVAVLWLGCAGVRPTCPVPTAVELELETSDRVNRDEKGESLPTVVRIHQLKDLSRFQSANFEDLWRSPEATLGDTLVRSDELTMFPGQISVSRFQRDEKADYVVGIAVYRQPAGQAWRTIQEWPLPGDPCQAQNDEDAAPKLKELRVRMFLRDYRIESVNNYAKLAKRSCPASDPTCASAAGEAPDELKDAQRRRSLRTFEEDPSAPQPTMGPGAK